MKVGKIIETLRKEKFPGKEQKDFASACGISQPHLSQIEAGTKKPSAETLQRICAVLEIPEAIVLWMATERKDVPTRKKSAFDILKPAVDSLISEFFTPKSESK